MGNELDFGAEMRRGWDAWLRALGQQQSGGASADAAFPWQEGVTQWMQLLTAGAPTPVQGLGASFQQQAGNWLGTMQQVASRFAGRDTSAEQISRAWREAVERQGDAMLQWMRDAARGGGSLADPAWLRDVARAFQSGFGGGNDWLNAPAFGPAREHQARWQALARMQREHQASLEAYNESMRAVLDDAFKRFEDKLNEHEMPGSQLTSARALFDLWIDAAEEAYSREALSKHFQHIYGELSNTQMRLHKALQYELERVCERIGIPTRTEMDAAHRRIAELERRLRALGNGEAAASPARHERSASAPEKTAAKAASEPAKKASAGNVVKKAATKQAAAKKTAVKQTATKQATPHPSTSRRGGKS